MSEKIIEGIWDCPYCDTDAIGGLQKHCPSCGHPQDKGTKFRLGNKKRYLSEEELKEVGTAPDWACEFCNSLNNDKFSYCKNCGAERNSENKNYFELREDEKETAEKSEKFRYNSKLAEAGANYPEKEDSVIGEVPASDNFIQSLTENSTNLFHLYHSIGRTTQRKENKFPFDGFKIGSILGGISLVVFLILGLVAIFTPKEYEATVSEKSWQREVYVEEYKTVEESAWDRVPSGGRLIRTKEEIRSYSQVLDHYETKTRQVSEQVFDGYDTYTYYTDNGNGTFTEHTSQTPRYRTEWRTEYYEEPVYKNVPVYNTKYYYEIEKWVYARTENSKGVNDTPYWPEYTLKNNERVNKKEETYRILFVEDEKLREYFYLCKEQDDWNSFKIGDKKIIVVSAGIITEIK